MTDQGKSLINQTIINFLRKNSENELVMGDNGKQHNDPDLLGGTLKGDFISCGLIEPGLYYLFIEGLDEYVYEVIKKINNLGTIIDFDSDEYFHLEEVEEVVACQQYAT